MKKTVKHILGNIWNFVLVWYTMPIFIIMIARLVIMVSKAGIDPNDKDTFEEFCMNNSRLLRIYSKICYRK